MPRGSRPAFNFLRLPQSTRENVDDRNGLCAGDRSVVQPDSLIYTSIRQRLAVCGGRSGSLPDFRRSGMRRIPTTAADSCQREHKSEAPCH
jgi:hypothetical protein